MIGVNIAHYKVTAKLGAGGMGEVYRATDSKLGRDVALKVLPAAFAQDAQRMARFQREAQVLASLNHPNIAAIYGLEEGVGSGEQGTVLTRALAMELVEGPTLAERIAQGALPLEETLPIAKQIAEALEYAHEKGIIHRDLKPANIKLTKDGAAKVLDFGLAKALSEDSAPQDISSSPTLSMAATKAGIILGTAAYMSPEQARGKAVDRRADIWSFGVVLYEMLAGKQLYGGETASDSMAAVITREPDWNDLPASTPRRIRELLRRCLAKDPRKRLQAIGDARIELEESGAGSEIGLPAAGSIGQRPGGINLGVAIILFILALGAGAVLQSLRTPAERPQPVARVAQPLPAELSLTSRNLLVVAISPDGSKIIHVGNNRLYVRSLDSLNLTELEGSTGGTSPFFSPDGQWIAFFAGGQTKKIQITGGAPTVICAKDGFDGSWGPDGTILIGTAFSGILSVPERGGATKVVVEPQPGFVYLKPHILPDGKSFFYVRGRSGNFDQWEGVMRSFEKDDSTVIIRGTTAMTYVPTGHLLYARLGELFVAPFDLKARRVTGTVVTVAQNVDYTNAGGTSQFALAGNGTLVYLNAIGEGGLRSRPVAVDRNGKETVLPLEVRDYSDPKISPDGRLLAVHLQDAQNDVWVADAARGTLSRISLANAEDETPIWSPDGRTVAWSATRPETPRGIFRRAADGSASEELLWTLDLHAHLRDWSPDGKTMLVEVQGARTRSDIWYLELMEKPAPKVFLQSDFNERNSRLSPDGRWVAYVSDESGRDEVYIQSFPVPGTKIQVSNNSGDQPVWSRDGKKLFFRGGGYLQEATFATLPRPAAGKPQTLFADVYESPQAVGGHTGYDVFPDGRFLMLQGYDPARSQQTRGPSRFEMIFIFNWFEELRRTTAWK